MNKQIIISLLLILAISNLLGLSLESDFDWCGTKSAGTNAAAIEVAKLLYGASIPNCIIPIKPKQKILIVIFFSAFD